MISDKKFKRLNWIIALVLPLAVAVLYLLPEDLKPAAAFTTNIPLYNAIINSLVAVCLVTGIYFIKNKKPEQHKKMMLTAFALSALFLILYVTYHITNPSKPFSGEGLIKMIYLSILLTHIIISAFIVPLVLVTINYSTSGKLVQHRKIAKYTFPLWLYVAVTGVVIYILNFVVYA